MSKSRVVNSAVNTIFNFSVKLFDFGIKFVLRTVFIYTLGMQYVGVSGLFTDILSVLSFVELGIGSAITYALYKPLAENDEEKLGKLMHFYKWAYRIVALVILICGLLVVPFLSKIVTNVPDIKESITIIYILYLSNTVCSYLLIYRSTILSASQKQYEISKISICISMIKCTIESILLVVFKNFIFYLLLEILFSVSQNIWISRKAEKLYPNAFQKSSGRLSKAEIKKLFKDIKALFLYKVSNVVLNGTDSVIVSSFLGTGMVGILANYNMIVKNIYNLVLQVFTSTSASIGNLAATEDGKKQFKVFNAMQLMCFWIFGLCTTVLYVNVNTFMKIWAGKENLFGTATVLVLIIDFYLTGMMSTVSHFRTSNGLFVQGQYRPLIMSIINIVVSVFLVKKIGITGVILGTVISRLLTQIWYDPYLIYKYVFKHSFSHYLRQITIYTASTAVSCLICIEFRNMLMIPNSWIDLIVNGIFNVIVFNGIFLLIYGRSAEFVYLKNIGINLSGMIVRKIKRR